MAYTDWSTLLNEIHRTQPHGQSDTAPRHGMQQHSVLERPGAGWVVPGRVWSGGYGVGKGWYG